MLNWKEELNGISTGSSFVQHILLNDLKEGLENIIINCLGYAKIAIQSTLTSPFLILFYKVQSKVLQC